MRDPGPILETDPARARPGRELGRSREGRPVLGWRFEGATSPTRISLIAGCHADEPVGPRFLRKLVAHLSTLPPDAPLLRGREWWIVPHANPDGEARNRSWAGEEAEAYDLPAYLAGAVRELPGDDVEFGFPRGPGDPDARPENRAVYDWWSEATGPFALHASLHGMAFAAGPWFLLEPAWLERAARLMDRLEERVSQMGHALHDVEREGDKGFVRVRRGFATRPNSQAMRTHFLERDDPETASRFRPSSMETIRALAGDRGDPLTLVSENPLFLTPGVGEEPGPPDPEAERWRTRIEGWRNALHGGEAPDTVRREAREAGLRPMPVRDQMQLQWAFVTEALALVEEEGR